MKNKKFLYGSLTLISSLFLTFAFAQAEPANGEPNIEVTPSFLFVGTKGDRAKFEEDNWTARNVQGGVENISFSKQLNKDDSMDFEGHAIIGNNDYNANFNLAREGVGNIMMSFKEFRQYFDGTGGFYERFQPSGFLPVQLSSDLHLDIGNFKIEGVLAKENAPEYSLGYEREFRHGTESLLQWGPVTDGVNTRYISPAFKYTNETVDKVSLGMKKVTKDTEFSAKETWESTKVKSYKLNNQTLNEITGAISNVKTQSENMDSDLYMTQMTFSKDLTKNLFMSCGLLYNHYVGGSMEDVRDTTVASYNENNINNPADIKQDTVTFMPNVSFTPIKGLVMGLGIKGEFESKEGDATYNRDFFNPTTGTYTPDGILDEYVNISTATETKRFSENAQFKYNRIKDTVLYGNLKFEKQFISQFENQVASGPKFAATNTFGRKTDTVADDFNYTLGCKIYPVSKVNFTVEDTYRDKSVDNRNEFLTGDVVNGYRGFIDRMELRSNSPVLKLNYKPLKWLATTFGYTLDQGIYGIRTRAGDSMEVAKYITHAYSAELTLTPADYFYCSLFYERRNDFTSTRADQAAAVQQPDYKADVDVLGVNGSYALTKATALTGSYSMYFTDNFNDFSSTGLPLGLNNLSQSASIGVKHSFKKDRSMEVKYIYKNYSEDSNNHINDYEAHLLYASMNVAF